jgi:prepilin-type processing-associated H-X9-DG protein
MPIPFSCPHCGKSMVVDDQFAGQQGPCTACGKPITIPFPSGGHRPASGGAGGGFAVAAVVGVVCLIGCLVVGGIMAALLFPAITQARGAAQRSMAQNNMKQILLAMHNYHDVNQKWPAPIVYDGDGNPLYSWRVELLPYMEQQNIYNQWDKTKAWDSPENMHLSQMMINVYRSPADPSVAANGTNYFVIIGDQTAFPPSDSITLMEMTDGTSNTIAIVEIQGISGSWAAPIDPRMEDITPSIGSGPGQLNPVHTGGINVGLCDGSVRFLSDQTPANVIHAALTRKGGEAVMLDY